MPRRTGSRSARPNPPRRAFTSRASRGAGPASLRAPPRPATFSSDEQGQGGRPDPALTSGGRIGDPSVDAAELRRMGNLVATRHVRALLARRRTERARAEAIDEVAALLLRLNDGPFARRLLRQMPDVGRIVDIYPLEVMVRMMERSPEALPNTRFGPVVSNAADIQARGWPAGEVIQFMVPLNMRLKAFALDGGGTPGYVFAPGPPAAYMLEIETPGLHHLFIEGEVRKTFLVDRVCVRVEDPPESTR